MARILIAEPLADAGVELLRARHQVDARASTTREELLAAVAGADALIVRSATRVDTEVLEAGRAQARNVPRADAALRQGRWERTRFQGAELYGKTLGIVGLGRVGALVAERLKAFVMRLLAYDPYVSRERAGQMGVELASLADVLARADVVTVHLPKTAETTGLIGESELAAMKPGARLVDTPHLGASTAEAQDKAGITIAEQLLLALDGQFVPNAVNVAAGPVPDALAPFLPLAEKLGRLYTALAGGGAGARANVVDGGRLHLDYVGALADQDTRVLTLAALKGVFSPVCSEPVTYVNAPLLASERGISTSETKTRASHDWVNLLVLSGEGSRGQVGVAGTVVGPRDAERLVAVNGIDVDMAIADHMAFLFYEDRPGVIGTVGSILGKAGVNIASMQVGRRKQGGEALMALAVDAGIPPGVLDRVEREIGAHDSAFIHLHESGAGA